LRPPPDLAIVADLNFREALVHSRNCQTPQERRLSHLVIGKVGCFQAGSLQCYLAMNHSAAGAEMNEHFLNCAIAQPGQARDHAD